MKILILTASTGGGHKRAAAAIETKIKSVSPETEVHTIDALKAIGKVYDKTVCGGYHFMATKVPKFYGECYKITDRKTLMYKAVMRSNTMMSDKLLETINKYNPDCVIICHPFVTTMLSKLKRQGKTNVKTISLITDYGAHRTYIVPGMDAYVLAEPQMKKKLIEEYNVDENLIHPLGIPIFDKFSIPFDKAEICKRENLSQDKPTVLLMAGSFGVTKVLDFYKGLAKGSNNIQLIVIVGKNKHLYERLEHAIKSCNAQSYTKLLYFVDNVEDYMHISDIIVTKPGGLTVTESLCCHLPMAIYSAFPGQERDNADYLVQKNVAIMLDQELGVQEIHSLLNNEKQLNAMKESCKELARPDSALAIFNLAKSICNEK